MLIMSFIYIYIYLRAAALTEQVREEHFHLRPSVDDDEISMKHGMRHKKLCFLKRKDDIQWSLNNYPTAF